MWREIFLFEIKYHLKQPLFYLAALTFALLAVLLASTDASVVFSSAPNTVARNAPLVIVEQLTLFSLIGLFVITAFVASSILRDFEQGTHQFFFTKPVTKSEYLMGRFTGSMVVSLALVVVTALGIAAGNFVPWQDPERLGSFAIGPFVYGLFLLALPNLLMLGAVLFAVACWSRRLVVTYLFVVFFVLLQDYVEDLVGNFENSSLGSILEPMGLVALQTATRYWTVAEYNTALPQLAGPLLYNRLLWLGVAALFLIASYARFSYSRAAAGRRWTKVRVPATAEPPATALQPRHLDVPRAARSFSKRAAWRQWMRQTRFETAQMMRGAPFIVLLVLALSFTFATALIIGENRGTPVLPVTHLMLQAIRIDMGVFLAIVVIFFGGELVWRERGLRVAPVCDALPTLSWVHLGAKVSALVLVAAGFVAAGIASTVVVQLTRGFWHLEPGLYARGFVAIVTPFVLLAVLSVVVQVVVNNKFIGYLLMIVLLLARSASPMLGLAHNLYRYGGHPPLLYSDMNGFGPYAAPFVWFQVYWGFGAAILLVLALLFWVRGAESPLRTRLAEARTRWRGPAPIVFAAAMVGMVASGAYIYYNTNVLNEYVSRGERMSRLASYERQYRGYRDTPLPQITAVRTEVAMFPGERRVEVRGSYRLENRGEEPIRVLPLTISSQLGRQDYLPFGGRVSVQEVDLPDHSVSVADSGLGFFVYELDEPLAPGGAMELGFRLSATNRGFKNHRIDNRIVRNGTFIANKNLLPSLGYVRANELLSASDRRAHDLPRLERTAAVGDSTARFRSYLDADWTLYETTISTSLDQIALAPGDLVEEWTDGDRRYFHYKTDTPIINLVVFISADYEVARDTWNDDVAIEVYYHPDHPYNVERLIAATKRSLDYFTTEFGPYQYRHARIVEVPNYVGLTAYGLAGTIPFSESWGFIMRVGDGDIDMVSDVTAHEMAHQWWNHQVVPADVQGATLIAETLAQYSALMVTEREVGPDQIRRFLRYELDQYLDFRSREQAAEMPLLLVENQPYIHYWKGSMIMYALQDYVGEEAINRALRRFRDANAFAGPPYATSPELLEYIREEVPDEFDYLIEDMFETITLFDNRAIAATCSERDDGSFLVTLQTAARKLRSNGEGVETEVPLNDWIDIGVFGEDGAVLFMEKHHITEPGMSFDVVVDERPLRAGIDPYNKLIDRISNDNVMRISETGGRE